MFVFLFSKAARWAWWLAKQGAPQLRAVSTLQVLTLPPLLLALLLLPWWLFRDAPKPAHSRPTSAAPFKLTATEVSP
ncbi:MAG: hypothetical protein AAGI53_17135 [Planctomycetota bacterium]